MYGSQVKLRLKNMLLLIVTLNVTKIMCQNFIQKAVILLNMNHLWKINLNENNDNTHKLPSVY